MNSKPMKLLTPHSTTKDIFFSSPQSNVTRITSVMTANLAFASPGHAGSFTCGSADANDSTAIVYKSWMKCRIQPHDVASQLQPHLDRITCFGETYLRFLWLKSLNNGYTGEDVVRYFMNQGAAS